MKYDDHIGSRYWNEIRQRILKRSDGKCEKCGKMWRLQIHHINYDRVGRELDSDLLAVCQPCHRAIHGIDSPDSPQSRRDSEREETTNNEQVTNGIH
tara:strand:+ start:397 stop:687 length:291 start_codon:yes stop_codon:yes gene_type:complete